MHSDSKHNLSNTTLNKIPSSQLMWYAQWFQTQFTKYNFEQNSIVTTDVICTVIPNNLPNTTFKNWVSINVSGWAMYIYVIYYFSFTSLKQHVPITGSLGSLSLSHFGTGEEHRHWSNLDVAAQRFSFLISPWPFKMHWSLLHGYSVVILFFVESKIIIHSKGY